MASLLMLEFSLPTAILSSILLVNLFALKWFYV